MKHRSIVMIALALFVAGIRTATSQETTVYSFSGSPDGSDPVAGVIFDAAGNLYGTTSSGGAVGSPYDIYGTVYELSPKSGGGWTEKVLYSFGQTSTDGIVPAAGLIFDARGNLYGTTTLGGANGKGTVFELSPASGGSWTEKVLYSFGATTNDASEPYGGLIFDAKGNLYGTTKFGGPHTVTYGTGGTGGTVFELSPASGGAWTEKVLYDFGASTTDGAYPLASLIMDGAGDLYGTTQYGGTYTYGTVFELVPGSGGTWTEKIIHSFNLNGIDGSMPEASLIFDGQGNLYGTTYGGGSDISFGGLGAVFELSPSVGGTWTEQVLFSFLGSDGDYPIGNLVFDNAGNLYGTASNKLFGQGLVFELSPASGGGWTENAIYTFGGTPDGHNPDSGLIFDDAGNLYGTASAGGSNDFGLGGTVYEITAVTVATPEFSPAPGTYTTAQSVKITDSTANTVIHYTTDGSAPTALSAEYSSPIEVSASQTIQAIAVTSSLPQSAVATGTYLIGTTAAAPQFSPGPGFFPSALTVTLTDATPGSAIYFTTNGLPPTTTSAKYTGPISVSSTETIEAIAIASGYSNSVPVSATYTVAPGPAPTEKVIYSFGTATNDGGVPMSNLISDGKGNFYGTTEYGGPNMVMQGNSMVTAGTVFELSPASGGAWTEKILYNFGANSNDGANPLGGLVFDSKGNLYGTTSNGGALAVGTVFELSPAAGGAWTETVIHNFDYILNDGTIPHAGLIIDSKGNLYGTTTGGGANSSENTTPGGTVFELSPGSGGTWTETLLHSFQYLNQKEGYYPQAPLVFDSKGNLYGTTADGGSAQDSQGGGTAFELTPAQDGSWSETILANFGGGSTTVGYWPVGGLVIDSKGNLYGTTKTGGHNFAMDGAVFELSPVSGGAWTETIVHNFGAYETDGIDPYDGLVFDSAGNLYGTTEAGGANGYGTVFKLTPVAGGGWTEEVLHSFNLDGTDGGNPYASVTLDSSGNLYGTTAHGGAKSVSTTSTTGGAVFELESVATSTPTAATPTFSPAAGPYSSAQSVTITDTTSGATIYYTTNGTTPTTSSTKYTSAITVSSTETIEAIAVASGYTNSAVATATYTITLPAAATPKFTPAAGTYSSAQSVTSTDTTSGATIYYTTNGTTPTTSSTKYTSAITVSSTETIEAIAVASGYTNSAVATATYTITLPAAATPTFSPAAGSYSSAQSVTITDTISGASIYYTTNGTTPTTSSTKYTTAITVSSTETIEAIAVASGYTNSAVATATYTITLSAAATPTFSPAAGPYSSAQSVTITDTTSGAAIYYTTNGTTPTTSSTKYTSAITVSSTETIEAIAVASGYTNSAVATATYTISTTPTAATPAFIPGSGAFTGSHGVTITDSTPGATIYYTIDGTTPSTSSAMYTGTITISSTVTIQAIAVAKGYSNSAVASATYIHFKLHLPDL
jgi:uncharacterized repeat protein (TIGR03803 family)